MFEEVGLEAEKEIQGSVTGNKEKKYFGNRA